MLAKSKRTLSMLVSDELQSKRVSFNQDSESGSGFVPRGEAVDAASRVSL